MQTYYRLDTKRIRGCIESQELKHYWVAEQAGVHKTTLRRWLNHSIEKVNTKHVTQLAKVLQHDWRQLVIISPCQNVATPANV